MHRFKLFIVPNLRLHAEEAAPVGGTSDTTPANGSQAEVSGDVQVIYGKLPEEIASTPQPESSKAPVADRNAEYSKIKNDYKDLYEADFKSQMGQRLKGKDKELGSMKAILEPLQKFFGMPDANALREFVYNDLVPQIEGGYQATELETGDGDAEASEALPSAADLAGQAQSLATKLKAQGYAFDLQTEIANPAVKGYLQKSLSLEEAYTLAHHDEILLKESQKAAAASKTATIEAIRTKGLSQVAEHVSKPAPQIVNKRDPRNWSDKEMEDVDKQVKRGGKVYL